MTLSRSLFTSTAIGLSMLSPAAYADVTAAEVWGDWLAYFDGMGYAVTATEATSGNTLSISDIAIQMTGAPDVDKMVLRMEGLQLANNGDGTVDVILPDTMPMTIEVQPAGTEAPTTVGIDYTQSGQKMTVSGDADAMVYDYAAAGFGIMLTSLLVEGEEMSEDAARLSVTGSDLRSVTTMTAGDVRAYDQSMEIGSLAYDMFFKDPNAVETMAVASTTQNVTFKGTSAVPTGQTMQTQDLAPMLTAGFAFDGQFGTEGTETRINVISEEGETKIKTGSASSTLAVAMDANGIGYEAAAQQVQVGAELAGLPFPLFAEMAQTGFKMRTPVVKSDEPQDFSLAFNATDFTMSDIIWAMFDPEGQLPRDPATVALDLSGTAKMLVNPMDPAAMQSLAESDVAPGELTTLRIDRLTVDAVGATLDATSDVTFDNTDKTTLPGFPKPVGEVNINLAGANGLMDKLVAMGLLPAEQVMGARMMMGMFAVPGDAPDTLKSRIEFNDAGQILANGQRLK